MRTMPRATCSFIAHGPRRETPHNKESIAGCPVARSRGTGSAAMTAAWSCLMAEGRSPEQKQWLGQTEFDMWPYRDRTVALLRKYARASVEVGRLPSLLGREC